MRPIDPDIAWMRMALRLARRGEGAVSPNPLVGAVVVKDGAILATGFHRAVGQDHAEVDALRKLDFVAPGATLYVNLEPCCHHGRTPPCMRAIARAGIVRVVIGLQDPNPMVDGRGIAWLQEQGVEVRVGVEEAACRAANARFVRWVTTGMPYVTLKLAVTLDGRIADRNGGARWISGSASRRLVHRWRAAMDCVWVGSNTARLDDPLLLPTLVPMRRAPLRVVVDSDASLPLSSQLVQTVGRGPVLVATREDADAKRVAALVAAGVDVWQAAPDGERVPIKDLLAYLGGRGVSGVLVEGGAGLAASLIREGLVDRLCVFVAPMLLGDPEATPMVADLGISALADARHFAVEGVRRVGDDVLIEMVPRGG